MCLKIENMLKRVKKTGFMVLQELERAAGIIPYDMMLMFSPTRLKAGEICDLLLDDGYDCGLDMKGNLLLFKKDITKIEEALLLYGCKNIQARAV